MTTSQKARKYGTAGQPPHGSGSTVTGATGRGGRVHHMGRVELAPQPTKSSSAGLVVGVGVFVGITLWLYYHFLVLPGFSRAAAAALPTPEMLVGGFDTGYAQRFATALGTQGQAAYSAVHATTGLLAPLLLALGWLMFSGLHTPQRARKWIYWSIGLTYALVFVVGNRVLENAVANPHDAAVVDLASGLVITRWVLLAGLLIAAVLVNVTALRRTINAIRDNQER